MSKKIQIFQKKNEDNKKLNFYLSDIDYKNMKINKEGELSNFCYAVKDNISVMDSITTGGSSFLKNYISPYNATIIDLLNEAGAIPLIKTNLDEFGLGGTGTFSFNGNVINPFDSSRITGGSSSGSGVCVAIDGCDFALGTDTGDSIRRPASYLGVIGYKPTYGLISRYGVFPYAPSFDHVGLFSKKIKTIQMVMNVIAKKDFKDYTSQDSNIDFLNVKLKNNFKTLIIEDVLEGVNNEVLELFYNSLKKIKNIEIKKEKIGKDLLNLIPSTYKIISYSEAVSCYQNMTGINFGENLGGKDFLETATLNRTTFFGPELKRRFIIGSFCTSEENYEELFQKSKKIRTIIINKTNELLKNSDFIISLGASDIAPKLIDIKENKFKEKNADNYLQISNFGGYPSITIPMGYINKMPIGINIMGKLNSDDLLLEFANMVNQCLSDEIKNV